MVDLDDVELAEDEATPPKRKGSGKKLIIFGVVAVLLFAMGGGGAWFLVQSSASVDEDADVEAVDEDGADQDTAKKKNRKKKKRSKKKSRGEAIYVPLEPAFTVNFEKQSGARFLQVSVEAMTRSAEMPEILKKHMPVIRNDLVMLFSSKSSEELRTMEGKKALQAEALSAVQKVMEEETGEKAVEAVFFTSFVMQ